MHHASELAKTEVWPLTHNKAKHEEHNLFSPFLSCFIPLCYFC